MKKNPNLPPNPRGGWSQSVAVLEQAVIAPPVKAGGLVIEAAVFDAEGVAHPYATTWRRDRPITVPPKSRPQTKSRLKGTWLFAGVLYHHFGHFQVESIARLWALRRFRDDLDGIVFISRDGTGEIKPFEKAYLRQLGCELPICVCVQPTQAERLIIPGQGLGLGSIAGGTRIFRRFVAEDFAQNVAQCGSSKLFISRSKQPSDKGGFIGEAVLDERMRVAGFEVFWPEEHSIEAQIARYKAAKRIVALDGSALHLFAMVARKDQELAVILRRERIASRSLRRQLVRFSGREPVVINALGGKAEPIVGKKRLISELDFVHIGRVLKRRGFLTRRYDWRALEEGELTQIIAEQSLARGS